MSCCDWHADLERDVGTWGRDAVKRHEWLEARKRCPAGDLLVAMTEAVAEHRFLRPRKIDAAHQACTDAGIPPSAISAAARRGQREWHKRQEALIDIQIAKGATL